MRTYGIPYMGSKSQIADKICGLFPIAKNFYDLFGGGFSITHFMLLHRSKHYEHFHFNEIRNGICDLIKDAIAGKYNYDTYRPQWVSRKEFHDKVDSDPFIKMIWSFGNNGKTYLFGKDIEQYKKSMHMAVVFNEFDETAKKLLRINNFNENLSITERRILARSLVKPVRMDFRQLQQLERLERLQRLERLSFYSTSYEKVSIKKDSVIYCDIPYSGTTSYDKNAMFNHNDFFNWAADQSEPVFISEYNVSDPRFKCIATFNKRSFLSPHNNKLVRQEKVYVNHAGYLAIAKLVGE